VWPVGVRDRDREDKGIEVIWPFSFFIPYVWPSGGEIEGQTDS
jgi:hypothetical protein